MENKPIEFYLTKKGLNFDFENPISIQEEKAIMEILKDGRRNILSITKSVNEKLNLSRTWEFIEARLQQLKEDGFVDKK